MENKINIARFKEGYRTAEVKGIWQWDYGQILRIQGLNLPSAVEIHFSLDEHGGEAARRIGVAKDGVTDVVIPDSMVENESAYGDSYYFFAYIYLTDETSGNTEYKIRAKVSTRSKPEGYVSGGNDTFAAILKTVNEIADDKVTRPLIAKVGQVLSVKATDESGKPTEFEATDQGGGVSDEEIANAVEEYMTTHPFTETDPTVPDWAKQPEKPTYTASEVGALPDTTKIPSKTSDLQNDSGFLTEHQDLSGYALKSEVPKSASEVGADASGTAIAKVSEHNTASNAHNDIRLLVQGLTERLNALADSDDTTLDQMSEVVAYIKSNKSLIDAITTSKVNVSDIIDNLTTNASNKPLSAAQGVALKTMIDGITIPTTLPNPNALTFTGAVTGSYDGSSPIEINIPEGVSSSGISAADATEGQVPTADGKGGWSWENQEVSTISNYYDAQLYGVDPSNTGTANTQALQSLIDTAASAGGGTIFISPGEYEFAISNTEAFDEHCIKLRSNVSIIGAGNTTILLPTGSNTDGFDMFYFNDLKDGTGANYLGNCVFRDFVVDGKNQRCTNYTTRGKAFMVNLFKNCHWERVTVRNTDATGFGMDCPINCSITDCVAESCGKAATTSNEGASGFGIGFGYSNDETITISGCVAILNKKFGIFFEHQKRFNGTIYMASRNRGMFVDNCTAMENYYNFGALYGNRVMFRDCNSIAAKQHGYYFGNCEDCSFCGCYSNSEGVAITSGSDNSAAAGYVIVSDASASGGQQTKDNAVINCISKYNYYGCKVHGGGSKAMTRNTVQGCFFSASRTNNITVTGTMDSLFLCGNTVTGGENSISGTVTTLTEKFNSWNT